MWSKPTEPWRPTGVEARDAIRWMNEAAEQARQATCSLAHCGAVIVTPADVIIGRGFNHPPGHREDQRMCGSDRTKVKPGHDTTCCMHAEWAAIMDALGHGKGGIVAATLYFTRVDDEGEIVRSGQPYCTVCSRLALDVGLDWFALWHPDDDTPTLYPADYYNRLSYAFETG